MATTAARWLPRIIFAVALFGALLVTDMFLQERFGRGCFGETQTAGEVGCAEVYQSAAGTFLGVSNLVWGFLFYLAVAVLRFLYATAAPERRERFRLASFGVVGFGFLYSAYLTIYQATAPELADVPLCTFCLASAATAALLFILHLVEHVRLKGTPPPRTALSARPFALMAAVAFLLGAADVTVASGALGGGDDAPATAQNSDATDPLVPPTTPPTPVVSVTDPAAQCSYDSTFAPIPNFDRFAQGPYLGSADAPVRVVEFFDPNCPHCKDLHAALEEVLETHGDQARFYLFPYPLWDYSFGQVQALRLAARQGKFYPMLDLMFARQQPGGLTLDQVVEIAGAVGLDREGFRAQLNDQQGTQDVIAEIMADRVAAGEAIANAEGRISVPKLAVDGRIVSATYESYSPECLRYFIEEAAGAEG